MRQSVALAQKLSTAFPRANGLPHHLGGAYKALDNAQERSVYVKVHPRPRSLGESQQVLYQLQKFGEIEVYRHLKYDFEAPAPNSIIAVYKDEAAADRARSTPSIEFQYAAPDHEREVMPGGASSTLDDKTLEDLGPDRHNEPCSRPGLLVVRSSTLQHLSHIQRQYYYWPVDISGSGNPGASIFGDLPPGMYGLRDFDVTKREPSARRRDGMSHVWNQKIKEQGWETLEELWRLGNTERVTKAAQSNRNESSNEPA